MNTQTYLYSCGGCPGTDSAKDCSEIAGADEVACVAGKCESESQLSDHTPDLKADRRLFFFKVQSCSSSYTLSDDGMWCVPRK